MSLLTIVSTPSGIVMSADSRTTFIDTFENLEKKIEHKKILSDNVVKISTLFEKFALGTVGESHLNGFPIEEHFIRFSKFIENKNLNNSNIEETMQWLEQYFKEIIDEIELLIFLIGYENQNPFVLLLNLKDFKIYRLLFEDTEQVYNFLAFGDDTIVKKLTKDSQFLFEKMSLQDAINFSRHLIKTTIEQMKFERPFPTIGGKIDTILITPNNAKYIVKKELTIEDDY